MKKPTLSILIFLLSFSQIFGNQNPGSRIVFYREHNHVGSAISYKIMANDSLVVRLRNNSYIEWDVTPGEYIFMVQGQPNSAVKLKVDEDNTYYVRLGIRTGMWSNIPELLVINGASAMPVIESGRLTNLDNPGELAGRPKNRIGVQFPMGFGFKSIPMFTMENDKESSISFGGGFGIALKYGVELGKHFDLAFDLGYQSSGLTPALNNATVSFGRGVLAVTPSLIAPIQDGYAMRLKIGAGLAYMFGTSMSIDGSKVQGGFKDDWDYTNALGYHFSTLLEMNTSEYWSFLFGVKVYGSRYDFLEGSRNYPIDPGLKNGIGSGLDLLMGIFYHF
jgi:hypothetical protein